MYSIVANMFQ